MFSKKEFERLYDQYFDDLSAFLSYYTTCPGQLEDWVQEVFLKIWQVRDKIDPNHPAIKSYLLKTARNHALKQLRKQKKYDVWLQERLKKLIESHPPNEPVINPPDFNEDHQAALSKIPPRARQAYLLSREDGLTYKEIASVMDISPKTVEAQISNALRILRKELSKYRNSSI